jgi:hypothetical protein
MSILPTEEEKQKARAASWKFLFFALLFFVVYATIIDADRAAHNEAFYPDPRKPVVHYHHGAGLGRKPFDTEISWHKPTPSADGEYEDSPTWCTTDGEEWLPFFREQWN